MRNQPSGLELLKIALRVLQKSLLPELSKRNRYNGLMVVRAIEIVLRQTNVGQSNDLFELGLLSKIIDDRKFTKTDLKKANYLLVKKIRNGDFTPQSKKYHQLWSALHQISEKKVHESNPKYFESLKSLKL